MLRILTTLTLLWPLLSTAGDSGRPIAIAYVNGVTQEITDPALIQEVDEFSKAILENAFALNGGVPKSILDEVRADGSALEIVFNDPRSVEVDGMKLRARTVRAVWRDDRTGRYTRAIEVREVQP